MKLKMIRSLTFTARKHSTVIVGSPINLGSYWTLEPSNLGSPETKEAPGSPGSSGIPDHELLLCRRTINIPWQRQQMAVKTTTWLSFISWSSLLSFYPSFEQRPRNQQGSHCHQLWWYGLLQQLSLPSSMQVTMSACICCYMHRGIARWSPQWIWLRHQGPMPQFHFQPHLYIRPVHFAFYDCSDFLVLALFTFCTIIL